MTKRTSEFSRQVQRRYGAMGMLIVAPVILLIVGAKVFERHNYPTGDFRNEPWFWALVGVAALLFVGIAVVGSVREIRRDVL